MLPGGKPNTYLIEDIGIAVIPVPQMLPDLLEDKKITPNDAAPTLLLVGDVDYGAAPGQPQPPAQQVQLAMAEPHRSAVRGEQGMEFPALPGTAKEIEQIEALYRGRFSQDQSLELKQAAATQGRVREEAPKYHYLHLATHGFFSPPTVRSALAPDKQNTSDMFQTGQERDVVGFNPGLLCGLALAGRIGGTSQWPRTIRPSRRPTTAL